ncbi:MAG TPA: hypothetical protein VLX29_01335, partial [Nitrospirota bacterium]|nr:hypothetical protein [Nitrospirota bacterium]
MDIILTLLIVKSNKIGIETLTLMPFDVEIAQHNIRTQQFNTSSAILVVSLVEPFFPLCAIIERLAHGC